MGLVYRRSTEANARAYERSPGMEANGAGVSALTVVNPGRPPRRNPFQWISGKGMRHRHDSPAYRTIQGALGWKGRSEHQRSHLYAVDEHGTVVSRPVRTGGSMSRNYDVPALRRAMRTARNPESAYAEGWENVFGGRGHAPRSDESAYAQGYERTFRRTRRKKKAAAKVSRKRRRTAAKKRHRKTTKRRMTKRTRRHARRTTRRRAHRKGRRATRRRKARRASKRGKRTTRRRRARKARRTTKRRRARGKGRKTTRRRARRKGRRTSRKTRHGVKRKTTRGRKKRARRRTWSEGSSGGESPYNAPREYSSPGWSVAANRRRTTRRRRRTTRR